MKIDKWITFTDDLLPLVMDGRKTVTRRVIVPQPDPDWAFVGSGPIELSNGVWTWPIIADGVNQQDWKCPHGKPGDVLGIKEGYKILDDRAVCRVRGYYTLEWQGFDVQLTESEYLKWQSRKFPYRRTPGRFMYRSLCRTRLLNKSVRVERVQDITHADILAEGITQEQIDACPWNPFLDLWDKINKARGHGWNVNPWVWRVEFEVIE